LGTWSITTVALGFKQGLLQFIQLLMLLLLEAAAAELHLVEAVALEVI
jgi:hypothetical protein